MSVRPCVVLGGGAMLVGLLLSAAAPAQSPEFRALWSSRFDWPDEDELTCKATLDALMQDLAAANFNAVLLQVRGQADTLYPSPYEVWSPLLGGGNPGWDPLAYAVAAAHAHGIELHAYINTHTCWQSVPASAHTLPPDPNHVFYAHCNASDPAHRDWLHHDSAASPVQFSESDYVWFAPGVPAYQAYVRRQVLYVVENYDVDGVHYDRIRTPWSDEPSYDPISLARFNDPQSNPDGLDFTAWTADQITRNVRDIYAAIMAVRPEVKVSAAVYSNPNTAPTDQHQDAPAWAQTGGLDMLVPMMYFTGGAGSTWDTRLQQWLAADGGRHVVAGQITSQGVTSLLGQVALTRTRGAQGNSVFSSGSFTFWSDYLAGVYATPVATPTMSWKSSPTTGIIVGTVTGSGVPVVDAQIRRNGSTYVGLASGDGFYSFLLVPPGTYTLTASHPAYSTAVASGVTVAAGQVVQRNIDLGLPVPPVIAEVAPDPAPATVGTVYAQPLTLTQGIAESWALMTGPSGAEVDATGLVSWTPAEVHAGQAALFTVRATNASGYDEESWMVAVAAAPSCMVHLLTDFDAYAAGERVLFNNPRYSGSTSNDLAATPDVAEVDDAATPFGAPNSYRVEWQFVDTDPQRWLRLTTYNGVYIPNPTVELDRPIRVRLRLDSGRLRLAVGIRETGTTAEVGESGGTSGTIEWVGAGSDLNGAPQGVLVEAQPGVWQTFVFDPLTDPIWPMNGDGVLWTGSNKGVLEHLAFAVVDGVGPFTVYIDDIDSRCELPALGDFDDDADADLDDFEALADCLQGPDVAPSPSCTPADFNDDEDVDLLDFQAFQREFTGG